MIASITRVATRHLHIGLIGRIAARHVIRTKLAEQVGSEGASASRVAYRYLAGQ